jgi:GPH family glycoside/pentoside/hexuronide:cation symporter
MAAPGQAEKLPRWKLILFALGQLGWSLASFGVSNLIPYFYMSPEKAGAERTFPPFIFEGVFLGALTIIGVITFGARAFDAFTNPLIASWSDRSKSRLGRRRYYMAVSFVPFALFSVLVFLPPQHFTVIPAAGASWLNIVSLCLTILVFYFFFVMYTAPYNALISELGHNPKERLYISTVIGVTWSLGFAVGNSVYFLKPILEHQGLSPTAAFQTVEAIFAVASLVLMALPVLVIDEKRYVDSTVSNEPMMKSLISSLKNKNFVRFLFSELLYNVCQTIIQMGLVYYVVTLLLLEEEFTSYLLYGMFALSLLLYPAITALTVRWEKKRMMIIGFALLALLFLMFCFMGKVPMPGILYACITVAVAAIPIAIFTIVPNAIVADVAEAHGIETGDYKAGMFFGVRSFETNVGISFANVVFPSLLLLGKSVENPLGIRMSAVVSVAICLAGMAIIFLYDEKSVLRSLAKKEKLSVR